MENTKADGRAVTPYWSGAGFAEGMRLALPAMPVMAMFGAAFGTFAAQKGLSLFEAALMSALMFAGASQFVAAEIWSDPKTIAGIVALVAIVATVNMRFVLLGAALHPWLGRMPAAQTYPALAVLTEPGLLIAMHYRSAGGNDAAILLGSGVALWLVWVAATVTGYLGGTLMADPARYGIDLVMPIFFTVMLVPLWRGPRPAIPWVVAGVTALLVALLVPGSWYIIAGTVAGSVAGGFIDERA